MKGAVAMGAEQVPLLAEPGLEALSKAPEAKEVERGVWSVELGMVALGMEVAQAVNLVISSLVHLTVEAAAKEVER